MAAHNIITLDLTPEGVRRQKWILEKCLELVNSVIEMLDKEKQIVK